MTRGLVIQALLIYLGLRLISGVLLVLASSRQEPYGPWTDASPDYFDVATLWDGNWYRQAAEQGWPDTLPVNEAGDVVQNTYGFYPAFPLTVRVLMMLTGLDFKYVAPTVSLLCGTAAAVLMAGLLARRIGTRPALAAVAVWGAYAAAPALQIAYSDAMAMLVLVGWFWLIEDQKWLATGLFTIVVGVTRPIAAPLMIVFAVALLARWQVRRSRPLRLPEVVSAFAGLAFGTLGILAWPIIAWIKTGQPDAYLATMGAWRPASDVRPFEGWVLFTEWSISPTPIPSDFAPLLLLVFIALYVASVLGPWASRLGPSMRTWVIAYALYHGAVGNPFTSLFRHAIPLFPLAAIAIGAGRRRVARTWRIRTYLFVALGIALQVAWIWKLLIFHPPTDFAP